MFKLLYMIVLIAAPPNPDPALAPFYRGLRQPETNSSCCAMADCRTVDYRMTNRGFEVFIDSKHFLHGNNQWVRVPPEYVLPPQTNPTGEAVACWTEYYGVLCFLEASGT